MGKNKVNVCYCQECRHEEATDCLDTFLCKCCQQADRIRFLHPVLEEESEFTEGKRHEREQEAARVREERAARELFGSM